MDKCVIHPIRPDVAIHVTGVMPPLDTALEAEIDRLWAAAAARVAAEGAGRLFNGRVFSIDTIAPDRIEGHITEYRRQVAQMENNALFGVLCIRPLAVVGVTRCADGIVIGKRHSGAVYQPGMWQLCPAGSVDVGSLRPDGTMDVNRQLSAELTEELGIDPAAMRETMPLCVAEHPGSHVCDLGIAVTMSLGAAEVIGAHRARGNTEYETPRIVPIAALAEFVAWAGASLVAPGPLFLARAGWLHQEDWPSNGW